MVLYRLLQLGGIKPALSFSVEVIHLYCGFSQLTTESHISQEGQAVCDPFPMCPHLCRALLDLRVAVNLSTRGHRFLSSSQGQSHISLQL